MNKGVWTSKYFIPRESKYVGYTVHIHVNLDFYALESTKTTLKYILGDSLYARLFQSIRSGKPLGTDTILI
jgi:hypothetical protein